MGVGLIKKINEVDRREFLGSASLAFGGILTGLSLPTFLFSTTHATDKKTMLKSFAVLGDGDRAPETSKGSLVNSDRPGSVLVFDLEQNVNLGAIPTSFIPHAFAQSPTQKKVLFAFEKSGRGFAEVDLLELKVINSQLVPSPYLFMGHALAFKEHVYATAMNTQSGEGLIAVINDKGVVEKYLPSHGIYPHFVQMRADGILVLNYQKTASDHTPKKSGVSPSVLALIDPQTGQLKKSVELGNHFGGYSHFVQLPDQQIVVVGSISQDFASSEATVTLVKSDWQTEELKFPHEISNQIGGEALGIATDAKELIFVSLPRANAIHVWNFQTKKHLGFVECHTPRALGWDEERKVLLASSAGDRKFISYRIDLSAGIERILRAQKTMEGGSGSHILKGSIT
jgi:hypothetical protein